jgi:hypothetical protein
MGKAKTVKNLLNEAVRGELQHQLDPYELRDAETSVVLKIDKNGDPIMDNSPEMEACAWRRLNANKRGLFKIPAMNKEHEGD